VIDGYRVPSATSWDEFAVNFQADPTGKLRIHLLLSGGSGTVYWDQVQVMPDWQCDFENGSIAPWLTFGGVSPSASGAASYSGLYSALETGGGGGIYQDIGGLTAGQFYKVTVRALSMGGTSGQAELYVHDTAGLDTVIDGPRAASSTLWDEFSVNFLATSSEKVRIHLIYTGGSGGVFFDDVTLSQGWSSTFENGALGPWIPFGSGTASVTNTTSNSGAFSLAETGNEGVYQDISGLVAGQLYNVSARVQSSSGATSQATLLAHDTTGAGAVGDGPRNASTTGWDFFSANFAADNTGKMRVHLTDTGGSGTLFWDDVMVSQALHEGFENGALGAWIPSGGVATITNALANTGTFSLAESGGGGLVYRDFSGLLPGQYYRVKVHARSDPGTSGQAELYVHDTTGANTVVDGPRTPSNSGWDEFAVLFLATGTGKIRIHLVYSGGAGTVYFDDVQVLRAWGSGFENGTVAPWISIGTTVESIESTLVYEGKSSLSQSGGGGGVYIDVPQAVAGQLYRITARGISASGTTAQGLLYVHDGTGANAVTDGYRTPSSLEWDEYAVTFRATGSGDIRVHLFTTGGSGSIYWDEVQILPILQ